MARCPVRMRLTINLSFIIYERKFIIKIFQPKKKSGISVGQICEYSCNSGYELRGEKTTTCSISENGSSWTNAPPSCEPVCGTPPIIDGAIRTCDSDGNTYSVDSKCQYECGDKSRMVGDDSVVCKKNLNGEAYWSDSRPSCIRKYAEK